LVPLQARFLENTFRRYDNLFEAMRFLISANRHQSLGEQHRELLAARKELHELKAKYQDLSKTAEAAQSVLARTQREKADIENELEKYRKWAYVKTGRVKLDPEAWATPLFELPSMLYLRSKKQQNESNGELGKRVSGSSATQDQKLLQTATTPRGNEEIEEEADEEDKQVVRENVQLCINDLEKHAVQMQQLLQRTLPQSNPVAITPRN
jgi:hypothetical protein